MKVGDLVRLKRNPLRREDASDILDDPKTVALITDVLEDDTGFCHYEVVTEHDRGWFSDLELEVINEAS